ncbi:hypothetical protein HS088_TW19G00468 [Tripterygium wilfordii]|uniref:Uncharacterized protein n=1 Tax=Tripterygium wilfordii TaxID=458696 RepID=A0A7J7CAV3_TRIWF|nr:hypothetical protein HS088_TW19G00468 [Tripterygium wilfordii]
MRVLETGMMALVIHQVQGSHGTFSSRPVSWSKGVKLKQRAVMIPIAGRSGRCFSLKQKLHTSIPCVVAVYMIHGADVLKDLTPLWVLGPLIVALYIKMFQALCALYVFTFRQSVLVNVAQGKLKGDVGARVWDPLANIKKNHKQLLRKKLEELKEWVVEMYLDFVESIWPYYCKTIKLLQRANLI